MPAGRPSDYDPAYCERIVAFCADGYSLTAFAGAIGADRKSITNWAAAHPEFFLAVHRAKAVCAKWWEDRGRGVALEGGPGGQATMVIFGLKNHAPDDFKEISRQERTGPDGGPVQVEVLTPEQRATKAVALIDETFGAKS